MSNDIATVPRAEYEIEKAYLDKENRRRFIINIILIAAIILTNVGWIVAWCIRENQYEQVTETYEEEWYEYEVTQDADGGDNYFVGRDGDINGKTTR